MPRLSIIVAIAQNRAMGFQNKLLFKIKEDLNRFKKITLNHPVIMGRKTFVSIGRLLPNRLNIIVTRDEQYQVPGAIMVLSIEEALKIASEKDNQEIFVIGGGQIFSQTINLVNRLYLTIVEGNYEADTYFPDYSAFSKVLSEEEGQSEGYRYTYLTLERP